MCVRSLSLTWLRVACARLAAVATVGAQFHAMYIFMRNYFNPVFMVLGYVAEALERGEIPPEPA